MVNFIMPNEPRTDGPIFMPSYGNSQLAADSIIVKLPYKGVPYSYLFTTVEN